MSADNGYRIKRIDGRFYAIHYFASDDTDTVLMPKKNDPGFDTIGEAFKFAQDQHSEYGVSIEGGLLESVSEERLKEKRAEAVHAMRAALRDRSQFSRRPITPEELVAKFEELGWKPEKPF